MQVKLVVDAMGGDQAPGEIIAGSLLALQSDPKLHIIFVGDEQKIQPLLPKFDLAGRYDIVHTSQWVTMDASPKKALLEFPEASILKCMTLVNEGLGDAVVSAGNTGASVLAAAQILPMIPGIERSALAAAYPTSKFTPGSHGVALLLDVGATLHCSAKQLVHFAYMGNYYMSHVMGIPAPRVGLLNNGEEETKGGEILVTTHKYLREAPGINFIGNVEGKDIPKGIADIIITEGFVGNVVLKMLEGVAEVVKDMGKFAFSHKLSWKIGLALLSSGVKRLKKKTDYSEYGGAPILGFKKLVIKAHGRSNAKAFSNAVRITAHSVRDNITGQIGESIEKFNKQHRLDFMEI